MRLAAAVVREHATRLARAPRRCRRCRLYASRLVGRRDRPPRRLPRHPLGSRDHADDSRPLLAGSSRSAWSRGWPRRRRPRTGCSARRTSHRTGSPTRRGKRASAKACSGQVDPGNAKNLELKWVLTDEVFGAWQATPLVADGVMYVTQRPNDVLAIDAKTGNGRSGRTLLHQLARRPRVLRRQQPRARHPRIDPLHGNALRPSGRHRRRGGPSAGGASRVGDPGARRPDHHGAARGEEQDPGRRGRRRIPASAASLPPSIPASGKELWRFYTVPGTGRARPRDLDRRHVADRRRLGVADAVWTISRPSISRTGASAIPAPTGTRTCCPGDNLFTDSVVALDHGHRRAQVALPASRRTTPTTTTRSRLPCWPTSRGPVRRARQRKP